VPVDITQLRAENERFYEKAGTAFRGLFHAARARNELHFALSLNPEFRGMRDPGWSSAHDAEAAYEDYEAFINEGEASRLKVRVALAFYCHLAEASGFYEIPKNMLRVAEGQLYNMQPFRDLVEVNRQTGNRIAPNANKVIRDLAGHAENLGFHQLAEVFRDAFDPEIRNGYSHADYVVWVNSLRLGLRLGPLRELSYVEFFARFERGANFFQILREVVAENLTSYSEPRVVRAQLAEEPAADWKIAFNPQDGTFTISG